MVNNRIVVLFLLHTSDNPIQNYLVFLITLLLKRNPEGDLKDGYFTYDNSYELLIFKEKLLA